MALPGYMRPRAADLLHPTGERPTASLAEWPQGVACSPSARSAQGLHQCRSARAAADRAPMRPLGAPAEEPHDSARAARPTAVRSCEAARARREVGHRFCRPAALLVVGRICSSGVPRTRGTSERAPPLRRCRPARERAAQDGRSHGVVLQCRGRGRSVRGTEQLRSARGACRKRH